MGKTTVAVSGADGFVGKNLVLRLRETGRHVVLPLTRQSDDVAWSTAIGCANSVIHLAGINRPPAGIGFSGNVDAARMLSDHLNGGAGPDRLVMLSSSQATLDNAYGKSKLAAEETLANAAMRKGVPLAIIRSPNIFGKWCKPNYNSAIATFCHNIARGLPIIVNDPSAPLSLLYIDDLIDTLIELIDRSDPVDGPFEAQPTYTSTVGEVADIVSGFASDRGDALIAEVGVGLVRALYSTFLSYLPSGSFAYELVSHRDPRGAFSEILRTRTSGQFSYFNALPGVTRGGHYHHTKTEKFLVVNGRARFRFRHVLTGETAEIVTSADTPTIVETIPGWVHDITNIGDDLLVSLLWANELFDRERPDTIPEKVA